MDSNQEPLFAYCGADGALQFGPKVPRGMLPVVAKCPDMSRADEWKNFLKGHCRRGYRDKFGVVPFLIPGVPEANGTEAGLEALEKFRAIVEPVINKEFTRG